MEIRSEHLSLLIDLIPKYRWLNSLYQKIVDNLGLNFESQCSITDFYNEFQDKQFFEKAILNLLISTDKENQRQIVINLKAEINHNIDLYTAHKDFLDKVNTLRVCTSRHEPIHAEVDEKQKDCNKLWQELIQVRNSLESASWQDDKTATQRLTQEEERLGNLYKKEQEKLQLLYERKKESDNHAIRYIYNVFGDISELSHSFISLLDNYYPVERKKEQAEIKPTIKPGLYFDMKLVSAIHHECNNVQFENMTEVDFYAILNLQPTNAKFIVKPRECARMCYLIYRLYEFLKTDNKAEWRTAILISADIKDTYYKSKYKEPESEIPSRKSESFAQRINKIFEYLS
jgi:hypothetical protein